MVYNQGMNNKANLEILPEDRVQLTNEQKNLIALALEQQIPPEDAEYIEELQKQNKEKNNDEIKNDPFTELSLYYVEKYGTDFGMIYLSAITGGEASYKETIISIEQIRASERINNGKKN